MFDRLGSLVLRTRVPIVITWAILALVAVTMVPSLASVSTSDEMSFLPANSASAQAGERLAAAFPAESAASTATIVFTRPGGTLTDADREAIAAVEDWLRSADVPTALADVLESVEGAADVGELAAMYRSADGAVEMLSVRLTSDPFAKEAQAAVRALRERLETLSGTGLEAAVTGTPAISSDYFQAVLEGTDRTTLATVVLVLVILLLIYRAPIAALVPLLTIGAAFAVARAALSLLAQAGWQIPSLLDSFIVVLVFGIGTDYAIFLLSRYREELSRRPRDQAASVTVGRIGAVITASAATVIVGLGSMVVASFGIVRTIGPALAVSVAVTLAAGLTLTPSLAVIAGRWLYWPRHDAVMDGSVHAPGAWDRLAAFITRRPGPVSVAVIAMLAVPLLALPTMNQDFDTLSELPTTMEARRGFDQVAAHFDRGQLMPVSVLLEARDGVDLGSPAGLAELVRIGQVLGEDAGITMVRSVVTPAGDGAVPEGFRPSAQLDAIADGLSGASDPLAALAALSDPETLSGLDSALAYLDGLGAAFPDIAGEDEFSRVRADGATLRDAVATYQAAADGSAEKTEALGALMDLAPGVPDEIAALAEVFRGRPDDLFLPRSSAGTDATTARMLGMYLTEDGSAARLSLVTGDEPYSPAAFATVRRVRTTLEAMAAESASTAPAGGLVARVGVAGSTAQAADAQTIVTADFRLVGAITVLGVFIVLAILLRSLVAPIYLVGSVMLSYATTLGIATLLFQGLLGQGGLNYLVPVIVFVLLVAVGSDYNIFLMSRVREESAGKDMRTGIAVASARTGTVITSAGIILAGTFVALTLSPLQILLQLGVTIAIGVLIDTFIVRSLLIPAITAFLGERAWWPSVTRRTPGQTAPTSSTAS